MKNERGITLVSLVVYIIVMSIVLVALTSIINEFYKNTNNMQEDTKEIMEFNKFNTYFLKEVKTKANKVDNISSKDYILFSSGNSFSYSNGIIYYNDMKVCEGVNNFEIGLEENEKVINVKLEFGSFTKSIKYKLEEIY